MSSRITIVVEGIDDVSLVGDIERTIRDSFHEIALPGPWRVIVRPSRASGQWDFDVHGVDLRHTQSIAVPPSLLSSLIPLRLRESLTHSLPQPLPTGQSESALLHSRCDDRSQRTCHIADDTIARTP
jgi:hypothetical protein